MSFPTSLSLNTTQLAPISSAADYNFSFIPSPSDFFSLSHPSRTFTTLESSSAPSPPFDYNTSSSPEHSSGASSPDTSYLGTPQGSPLMLSSVPLEDDFCGQQQQQLEYHHNYQQQQQPQLKQQAYDFSSLPPPPVSQISAAPTHLPLLDSSSANSIQYPLYPSPPQQHFGSAAAAGGNTIYSSSSSQNQVGQQNQQMAIPMLFHPIPQLGNQQQPQQSSLQSQTQYQQFYQQQQQQLVQHQQMLQQQQQFQSSGMPLPLPLANFAYAPAPSFETPQGTYYFVPNTAAGVVSIPTEQWGRGVPMIGDEDKKPVLVGGKKVSSAISKALGGKKSAPRKNSGKGQVKRFICPQPDCGRGFARNFNMQSHLKSHLGIRDFDCPHCPKKFSRRHDRARHCAAVHDAQVDEDFDRLRRGLSAGSGDHEHYDEEDEEEDAGLDVEVDG